MTFIARAYSGRIVQKPDEYTHESSNYYRMESVRGYKSIWLQEKLDIV